jgi:lipoprotein NlpI
MMIAAVALALLVAAPPPSRAAQIRTYVSSARTHFAKSEFDAAIADLTGALKLDPKNVAILVDRGAVYDALGEFDLSLVDYNRAVALNPRWAPAVDNRGNAYAMQGDYDKSLADHTRALQIDPTYAGGYRNRALTYFLMGQYALAAADDDRFLARNPQMGYARLWTLVAHGRAGTPVPTGSATNAPLKGNGWPQPLLDLYAGTSTPDLALAAATSDGQKCEAAFYIAEWQLGKADPAAAAAARAGLTQAVATCPHAFVEYVVGKAELARLPAAALQSP